MGPPKHISDLQEAACNCCLFQGDGPWTWTCWHCKRRVEDGILMGRLGVSTHDVPQKTTENE